MLHIPRGRTDSNAAQNFRKVQASAPVPTQSSCQVQWDSPESQHFSRTINLCHPYNWRYPTDLDGNPMYYSDFRGCLLSWWSLVYVPPLTYGDIFAVSDCANQCSCDLERPPPPKPVRKLMSCESIYRDGLINYLGLGSPKPGEGNWNALPLFFRCTVAKSMKWYNVLQANSSEKPYPDVGWTYQDIFFLSDCAEQERCNLTITPLP